MFSTIFLPSTFQLYLLSQPSVGSELSQLLLVYVSRSPPVYFILHILPSIPNKVHCSFSLPFLPAVSFSRSPLFAVDIMLSNVCVCFHCMRQTQSHHHARSYTQRVLIVDFFLHAYQLYSVMISCSLLLCAQLRFCRVLSTNALDLPTYLRYFFPLPVWLVFVSRFSSNCITFFCSAHTNFFCIE